MPGGRARSRPRGGPVPVVTLLLVAVLCVGTGVGGSDGGTQERLPRGAFYISCQALAGYSLTKSDSIGVAARELAVPEKI